MTNGAKEKAPRPGKGNEAMQDITDAELRQG